PPRRSSDLIDRPDGSVALFDGDTLLAEAVATELQPDVPRPPSLEEARAASAIGRMRMTTKSGNAYLHCFGCGLAKGEHEGLRITPTPAGEADQVAAEWIPHEAFADESGLIPPGVVWPRWIVLPGLVGGSKPGEGTRRY